MPAANTPPDADLVALRDPYLYAQLRGDRREALRVVVDEGLGRGLSVAGGAMSAQAAHAEHVLNVNDRAPSRDLVTQMLRSAGFGVVEAETGERALARVQGGGVDAVVAERKAQFTVRLPLGDGGKPLEPSP